MVIGSEQVADIRIDEPGSEAAIISGLSGPAPGAVPAGFRAIERLDDGAYARLVRAVRVAGGRPVLLEIAGGDGGGRTAIGALRNAWELTHALDEPAILRPIERVRDGKLRVLVFDDPGWVPFHRWAARWRLGAPPADPRGLERRLELAVAAARAVAAVHARRLVHLDLRPCTLLVEPATGRVCTTGFGHAGLLLGQAASLDVELTLTGSRIYLPPERTGRTPHGVDSRADLYALGVIFYELFTGEVPFADEADEELVHAHLVRTPRAPASRRPELPVMLSRIVTRLLHKAPADRYQTARGLAVDLERCLDDWRARGSVTEFAIAADDVPDRLRLDGHLYGREDIVARLRAAFDEAARGPSQTVVLHGPVGSGKSTLAFQLQMVAEARRGYFVAGHFEPREDAPPYRGLAQAFRRLIRQRLRESPARRERWRARLVDALGDDAGTVIEVLPELAQVLGAQSPAPVLSPAEAAARFARGFRAFVRTITVEGAPLVVFLDDLQWADPASVQAIRERVLDRSIRHLLLVAAYRPSEVDPGHPLEEMWASLRESGLPPEVIALPPLDVDAVAALFAAATSASGQALAAARPLAALLVERTGGNPLLIRQTLDEWVRDGALQFVDGAWRWSLDEIRRRTGETNFDALTAAQVAALPTETVAVVRLAACVGSTFELGTLARIAGIGGLEVYHRLLPAIASGLVVPSGRNALTTPSDASATADDLSLVADLSSATIRLDLDGGDSGEASPSFRFVHDRVQASIYERIEPEVRARVGWRVGRALVERTAPAELEGRIFEIVGHFNRGLPAIDDVAARGRVVRLNQIAARRARAATVFDAAKGYLDHAAAALPDDAWETQYELAYAVWADRLHAALVAGALDEAEAHFAVVFPRARTRAQKAALYKILIRVRTLAGREREALDVAFEALAMCGVAVPTDRIAVDAELAALQRRLGPIFAGDPARALFERPNQVCREQRHVAELLMLASPPSYFVDPQISMLLGAMMMAHAVDHGVTRATAFALASCPIEGPDPAERRRRTFRARALARQLAERTGDRVIFGRTIATAIPSGGFLGWPLDQCVDDAVRGFRACADNGDRIFAVFCTVPITLIGAVKGDELLRLGEDVDRYLQYTRDAHYEELTAELIAVRTFVDALVGETSGRYQYMGRSVDAAEFGLELEHTARHAPLTVFRVLQARAALAMGELERAWAEIEAGEPLMAMWSEGVSLVEYAFVRAVVAGLRARDATRPELWLERARAALVELDGYVAIHPPNFGHKAAIARAVIAAAEGAPDVARAYEHAIALAGAVDARHDRALAFELRARHLVAAGRRASARADLVSARVLYSDWGAARKVAALEREFGVFEVGDGVSESIEIIEPEPELESPVATGDGRFASALTAAEALSGEMPMATLLERVVELALQAAGGQRIALLTEDGGDWTVAAEGFAEVCRSQKCRTRRHEGRVPESIIEHVVRTQSSVRAAQPSISGDFRDDPYFRVHRPKASLCTPAMHHGKVAAIFYIEHDSTESVFPPAALEALALLSAQAAAAICNARLYASLERTTSNLHVANARLAEYTRALEQEVSPDRELEDLVGTSPAFRELVRRARDVARTDTHVLIAGEGGTGKEHLARAVHRTSARRDAAFVKMACRQESDTAIAMLLFGPTTGEGMGRVALADRGTLYLEEVDELPLASQDRLLRVLEDGAVEHPASGQRVPVDLRLIASTSVELSAAVRTGQFREDLYYRLNVFPLHIPPLRERRDDIEPVARALVRKLARRLHKPLEDIDPDSLQRLMAYSWPGNVTELKNVLERAAIVARDSVVRIEETLEAAHGKGQPLGSYRLLDRIGVGGMGEVWRARHHMLRRPAAVKLIPPDKLGRVAGGDARDRLLRRFEREAQATAALRSPNTVELYDFGVSDSGTFYYVMEYLEGVDLETLVKRFGPQPPERVVYLLRQACRSLAEAHQAGLVHRDIKAANIYTTRVGIERDVVKVLDFGLVKSSEADGVDGADEPGLTVEGTVQGTPAYMAPEMALGEADVDHRVDLYALGCVAFWLLTGQLVFEAPSIMKLLLQHIQAKPDPPSRRTELDVPPELDAVVLACLAKDRDDRPADALALEHMLAEVPLEASWEFDRAERWWRMHLPPR